MEAYLHKKSFKMLSLHFIIIFLLTGVFVRADLVGHWRFDENTGSAVADESVNGNNGIFYNMSPASWVGYKRFRVFVNGDSVRITGLRL